MVFYGGTRVVTLKLLYKITQNPVGYKATVNYKENLCREPISGSRCLNIDIPQKKF